MWKDIVIGQGDSGCSSYKALPVRKKGDFEVSKNANSFWVRGGVLELGMTIFRNTPEGMALKELLNEHADVEQDEQLAQEARDRIQQHLYTVMIANLTPELLLRQVRVLEQTAFKEGQQNKVLEIRKVLTL